MTKEADNLTRIREHRITFDEVLNQAFDDEVVKTEPSVERLLHINEVMTRNSKAMDRLAGKITITPEEVLQLQETEDLTNFEAVILADVFRNARIMEAFERKGLPVMTHEKWKAINSHYSSADSPFGFRRPTLEELGQVRQRIIKKLEVICSGKREADVFQRSEEPSTGELLLYIVDLEDKTSDALQIIIDQLGKQNGISFRTDRNKVVDPGSIHFVADEIPIAKEKPKVTVPAEEMETEEAAAEEDLPEASLEGVAAENFPRTVIEELETRGLALQYQPPVPERPKTKREIAAETYPHLFARDQLIKERLEGILGEILAKLPEFSSNLDATMSISTVNFKFNALRIAFIRKVSSSSYIKPSVISGKQTYGAVEILILRYLNLHNRELSFDSRTKKELLEFAGAIIDARRIAQQRKRIN